jgi:hypothetical protein
MAHSLNVCGGHCGLGISGSNKITEINPPAAPSPVAVGGVITGRISAISERSPPSAGGASYDAGAGGESPIITYLDKRSRLQAGAFSLAVL